ncbi:MAG: hypothetical protein IJ757_09000 [Clostridiales bacterium]|nr:hypothetical protein [Clostridiales bacterium]
MKSRKTRKYYYVWEGDDYSSYKLPKGITDSMLAKLRRIFGLALEFAESEENLPMELSMFIEEEVLPYTANYSNLRTISRDILDNIEVIQEMLKTHQDSYELQEDVATLSALGYQDYSFHSDFQSGEFFYEKRIENNDEKEIVEEVYCINGEINRRIRTIIWEEDDTGMHSKDIRYRKLPIGKKLMKAILNTQEEKMR